MAEQTMREDKEKLVSHLLEYVKSYGLVAAVESLAEVCWKRGADQAPEEWAQWREDGEKIDALTLQLLNS